MKSAVATLVASVTAASLVLPEGVSAQSASPRYELSVERIHGEVYNPWTLEMDAVELRAFQGEGGQGLVAPTMRVSPGEILSLRVQNKLATCSPEEITKHECYNSTNIHTHGLWVSPSGNSDNVMISISPGEQFEYEFVIPPDHPSGTFWYHPHMHGATSIQLGSGMAGALIIDGDRVPTMTSPGDIDILFSQRDGQSFGEKIMVFSQIQYGCHDQEGKLKAPISPDPEARPWEQPAWACEASDVGTVDRWNQFGVSMENRSKRFTGINGQVHPTLSGLETGRFQRLRMIHAGLRHAVRMSIRRLADGAPPLRDVPAQDHRAWIAQYCTGEPIEQFHFADDGLTRTSFRRTTQISMFPGSRLDSLVYFEQPGHYCMVDDQRWRMQPDEYRMLGILEVSGRTAAVANVAGHLAETLMATAEQKITDSAVRERIVADLSDRLKIGSFSWHEPVSDEEITGYQKAAMTIEAHEDGSETYSIDGQPHEHGRIDRLLTVGDAEEWELTSTLGGHPFHIHVNPFQVVAIRDREGRDVTIEGSEAYDPDYGGMIGGWRDTLIVKQGRVVTMRTRYRRYIGDFVMHCHLASHGDMGMMQNVRLKMPGNQHTANKEFLILD